MCQFNIIFVKNAKNKKTLENSEYHYLGWKFNNFSAYVNGICNCDSFVSLMSDYNGNSYLQMVEELYNAKLKRLNEIKTFMNKPDYKKLREEYISKRDELSNAVEKLLEPISNYEFEQINLLEAKYKSKNLRKQLELLHKNLDNKFEEIQCTSEYKIAEQKLNEFIEKNQLMEESTLYYLTKEDEYEDNISNEVLDDDLFEYNNDLDTVVEYIDIPELSFVIDTVIQNLENRYANDFNTFLEYKQLFETLLQNEEYILFGCIWDKPGEMSIEKEVNIKDIKIEDLASLTYDKILKIIK